MDISSYEPDNIKWQAHRGGGGFERPDNTLVSLNYGWEMGGIPEVDIRLTSDGVLVCQHDNTLRRTTDAPDDIADLEIAELSFEQIRKFDAGAKFSEKYRGEKVPAFYEVLEILQNDPEKMIYADLKNYDPELFPALKDEFTLLVNMYEIAGQIILCSSDYELNCQMAKAVPGIKVMQWIGGSPETQKNIFNELVSKNFDKLHQIQFHLNDSEENDTWPYTLDLEYLKNALEICKENAISMQVFPWQFENKEIFQLLDIGIRWFTTDEPEKFIKAIIKWQEK